MTIKERIKRKYINFFRKAELIPDIIKDEFKKRFPFYDLKYLSKELGYSCNCLNIKLSWESRTFLDNNEEK